MDQADTYFGLRRKRLREATCGMDAGMHLSFPFAKEVAQASPWALTALLRSTNCSNLVECKPLQPLCILWHAESGEQRDG